MQEFSAIYDDSISKTIYRTVLAEDRPIALDCGEHIGPIKVAYKTFGQRLDGRRENAILVCHAFTGDQFPLEENPVTGTSGWWETAVGPTKAIDTNVIFT